MTAEVRGRHHDPVLGHQFDRRARCSRQAPLVNLLDAALADQVAVTVRRAKLPWVCGGFPGGASPEPLGRAACPPPPPGVPPWGPPRPPPRPRRADRPAS